MGKEEVWKDIPNYEGYYQVSDKGRVRSLDRTVLTSNGHERLYKGRIIEGNVYKGYRRTALCINGKDRHFKFSQLVAIAFLGHEPNGHTLIVDHINGDRSNDRVDNLRIVTHRENTTTCFRSDEGSFGSQYVGISWGKSTSKWETKIQHNKVQVYLGCYDTELEASNVYQSALSKIKDGSFNLNDYKPKFTSRYKGVSLHKASGKWQVNVAINGKVKYLGCFPTEIEAYQAYQSKLKELNNKNNNINGNNKV